MAEEKNKIKNERKKEVSSDFQRVIEYLISTTADITLKAFSGIIMFLLLDGVLGFLFKESFHLTKILFHLSGILVEKIGATYTFLTIYFLFWAWGKIIYILRQPIFLDFLKDDYILSVDKTKEIDNFVKLRSQTIHELEMDLHLLENRKSSRESFSDTDRKPIRWKELITNNDYLLYQILAKIKTYYKPTTSKRSSEADELAFIGTNFLVVLFLVSIIYCSFLLEGYLPKYWQIIILITTLILTFVFILFTKLIYSKLSKKGYLRETFWQFGVFLIVILLFASFLIIKFEIFNHYINFIQENIINNLVILGIVDKSSNNLSVKKRFVIFSYFIFLGFIAVFLFLFWGFFRERIARRYISRNTRLYINYLLDTKGFVKRLEEQEREVRE